MGEDFLQKKHRQFERCTDAAFQAILDAENLFSEIPADVSEEVIGFASDGVQLAVGDELYQLLQPESETEVLCHGKSQAVELIGEAAAVVRRLGLDSQATVTAKVVAVSPDGLITLLLHKPYTN